jgi:hypothetical protein
LAIEAIIKEGRNNPFLLINVRTIYRNLVGSLPDHLKDNCLPGDLATVMVQELATIRGSVPPQTKVIFYLPSYKGVRSKFPLATVREPRTPKQINYYKVKETTLKLIEKEAKELGITVCDMAPPKAEGRCLIITHYPVDLLAKAQYIELILVESHTGVFKRANEWNTKLNTDDFYLLPFNELTLQVFGDSNGLFRPMDRKIKKAVLDIAKQYLWNSMTTRDKISYSLSSLRDRYTGEYLKKLLR